MVLSKPKPVGIDLHIQKLQLFLYPELKKLWKINNDTDFDCFGRAYKNQTKDGIIPEVFIASEEYKEVLVDDRLSALSFFISGDTIQYNAGSVNANVSLIFMANLEKIKPGNQRNDEEVHVDVQRLLMPGRYGFRMTSFETGVDTVLREFSGWRKSTGMKYRDMQPFHLYRVNMILTYSPTDC
jgi:hypothetical protein